MGVLSNKIHRDLLKLGDHIYSWRRGFLYAHHGIYDGEGNVIHFTRGAGRFLLSSSPSLSSDKPCPNCGYQSTLDGVISSCIDCFLSGGDLYRFEYGVNLFFFIAQVRGGTCTRTPADPPEDILHRASFLLQNGFGNYDVFKNNCEDFALYCKTGLLALSTGRSGQVATLVSGMGVLGISAYWIRRCQDDKKVPLEKVPVEKLITRCAQDERVVASELL